MNLSRPRRVQFSRWLLPNGQAYAVSILQREGCFFIGEAKLLSFGPHGSNLRGRSAWLHQRDRGVEVIAAAFVGVDHGVRGIADGEAAVIAGAIAHVGMQN